MGLVMIPVILLAALIGLIFGNIPLWKYARKQHRKFSEEAGKEPRWLLFYLSMIPAACLMLIVLVTPFVFFLQGTAGAGAPTGDSLIVIILSFFVFGLAPGLGLILAAFGWKLLRSLGLPDWGIGTAVVIAIFTLPSFFFSLTSWESNPSLSDAARSGDVELIQSMIDDADVNKTDTMGVSPLILAAASSDEAVALLLEAGADVNAISKNDRTALIEAAKRSDNAVEMLIAAGADVNLKGKFGTTPLVEAMTHSDRAVELLIAAGADVNLAGKNGQTPLLQAAAHGDKAVELLIAAGADVNVANIGGVTPLMRAARGSLETWDTIASLESINRLLEAGADVNARADSGETALTNAVEIGRADIVERLLAAGADWRLAGKSGRTALFIAGTYSYYDIQQMLKQAGAEY